MKFGVVIFPGSNCDNDVKYVLSNIVNQTVVDLWHKTSSLEGVDAVILPGGFSYGDYLRSGAIAKFSPIMAKVIEFANNGGFVFGICNGFQILCESGLLPGTLLQNNTQNFICKNVFIKCENNNSTLTKLIKSNILKIPIAHHEGRYFAEPETIKALNKNGQVLFRYCDAKGSSTEENNPNGSVQNIAGICNEKKNVFGMMPHPERASSNELSNTDGKIIFDSIISSLAD
jgi:phosphoribosylformylglycinamidine synthase subunit PurQ / glutaminase